MDENKQNQVTSEVPYVRNGPLLEVSRDKAATNVAALIGSGGERLELHMQGPFNAQDAARMMCIAWNYHDPLFDALSALLKAPTDESAINNARNVLVALDSAWYGPGFADEDEAEQARLNAWFQVLHRLARIQETDPMAPAWTDTPLDPTVAELSSAGMVMIWDEERKDGKIKLVLRPEGWDLYDEFCQDLASQGRPIQGWKPGRHRTWFPQQA